MASSAAAQNPADLCNLALVRMGYTKGRVGSLYDGSQAAKKFLDVYGQTRDELLRSSDWGFAERNIVMTMLKQAPAAGYIPPAVWNPANNPPLPWLYEYAYPADCLKVRAVKNVPLFVPNFDPQPNVISIANDNALNPPQRVVLCNVPLAVMVYTGQITDPLTWDVQFIETFAAALARHVTPGLMGAEAAKMEAADEANEAGKANMMETQG